jgi:glycosyltransferase involved in cell wall biosynthesis
MEVIEDIIAAHSNITVINQKNLSLSVARNNGIAAAQGEYILMPDSDDLLIENSLKPLLDIALETKADLVVADFLEMTDEEIAKNPTIEQPPFTVKERTGEDFYLQDYNPGQSYVWRVLYRRAFLQENHISFVPGISCQDVPFTHECYLRAEKCIRTHWLLNIYRRGHESATYSFNKQKAKDFCIVIAKTWELTHLKDLSDAELHKLKEDVYTSFFLMMYSTLHSIKSWPDQLEIIHYLNRQAPTLRFTNNIKQKFESFMFSSMPRCYLALRRLQWKWINAKKQLRILTKEAMPQGHNNIFIITLGCCYGFLSNSLTYTGIVHQVA